MGSIVDDVSLVDETLVIVDEGVGVIDVTEVNVDSTGQGG